MTRTILIILAILLLTLIAGASDIGNNCCNLPGRHCQTNSEWIQGYYDFVNNQCQPPASAAQSETATQPTPTPEPTQSADTSQDIDNCCFLGWQCESDAQWNSGYFAHQAGDACTTESQQSYQRGQARNAQSQSQQHPQKSTAGATGNTDQSKSTTYGPCRSSQLAQLKTSVDVVCSVPDNDEICQRATDSYNQILAQCGRTAS